MKLQKPKFWDKSKFSILALLFFPFSILFFLITLISKFKNSKKFPIPIICVGNIYIGGTGKTPLASEIFKITKSIGKNPGFIKKHYDYLSDEIKMLKKVGITFVSKSRKEAIESLINNKNDIAILDDGFQDFSIEKKFSIVCFNQKQWIGNGFIIPSGPLRENLSAINRADCIFINGNKDSKIEDEIYKKNKNVKIFYSKYKPIDINRFKNDKIIAFSGIGNPTNFFNLLKENNLNLIKTISFPDHYYFSETDIEKLLRTANNKGGILLTTEKDYCRFNDSSIIKNSKIQFLKIELEIENKNNFIELLKNNI